MKKLFVILTLAVLLISNFFGNSIINAMADDEKHTYHTFYKSILIEEGDSLWSIAQEYNVKELHSTKEYIEELKRMNNLSRDTIHAGEYLTIAYYSESANSSETPAEDHDL